MSFTHNAALRTAQAAAVLAAIDSGTAGSLEIIDSGTTVISTHALSSPAGVVSAEVLTFSAIGDSTGGATVGGVADHYLIKDSAGTVILTGGAGSVTATGGGGDFTIASTTIAAGATVSVTTGATYTASV